MENKNCYKCNSNSTVYDLGHWVCANCIEMCTCPKNHQTALDWDFNQGRLVADGYTIEAMEFQTVEANRDKKHVGY